MIVIGKHITINVLLSLLLLLLCTGTIHAQHDSLVLKNGNIIVGEIKSLEKGVVTMETSYSKNDFKIEWSGIKEIYSTSIFLITLTDGRRINGTVHTTGGKKVLITGTHGENIEAVLNDIVYLKGLKSDFWSRFNASADIGLSLTKANGLRQLSANINLGYLADKWETSLYYSMLQSTQDSVATTKRIDAGLGFKYYLRKDWFLSASVSFLSNTEQALKLRTVGKLGAGRFFIHTNKRYWAGGAGLSFNNESFTNDKEKRNSIEAYAGTELNLFDVGDLDLLSSLYVYPSLTESGRWRVDFKLDLKYDLPLSFYIKANWTVNYDNRPAIAGNETDYILGFTVGWEL